jgi:hypothetical protein
LIVVLMCALRQILKPREGFPWASSMALAFIVTSITPTIAQEVHVPISALRALPAEWIRRDVAGWTLRIRRALLETQPAEAARAIELLEAQLREIERVVPRPALAHLKDVPLWFSPEYPGTGPRAEFHPGAEWLRENGRDPIMVRGVEFTNIAIFAEECRRMPNFALHELAHAYHHRVLSFDEPRVVAAFEAAKQAGRYVDVEVRDAAGNTRRGRHYGLTNPQEYFAEGTEAFFSTNDFFPYRREQLAEHDPGLTELLDTVWRERRSAVPSEEFFVTTPPPELNVPAFHAKYVDADGFPIVASVNVSDYALKEAAYWATRLLAARPDVKQAMVAGGARLCILGHNEYTTDLPEFAWLEPKDYWDARARGTGGSETDPYCSVGEENLLAYPGNPYSTESILIHEFAHNIHLRGMVRVDPTFDERVKRAYDDAMAAGLWRGAYASVNHHEYFAEGVQSWFDNNREPDHDHNHVNTRAELIEYDPQLAALCREVFGATEIRYTKPATRLTGHLDGYDPASAPAFRWPEHLDATRREIREKAQRRAAAAAGDAQP